MTVKGDYTSTECDAWGYELSLTAVCKHPRLYGSQIWGCSEKKGVCGPKKGWRGPTYKIPISRDGNYELNIKTIDNQPDYTPGTRVSHTNIYICFTILVRIRITNYLIDLGGF